MYTKKLFIVINFVLVTLVSTGQDREKTTYPLIGQEIPDFKLDNIQYFKLNKANYADLKGKPLILDFFSMGCSACFASFHKTNKLYDLFKDRVNLILIGKEHRQIRDTYETFRKRQDLDLPVTYQRYLLEQWKISGFPRIIWIDAGGVVRAVTGSKELTEENIRALIDGDKFSFRTDYSFKEEQRQNLLQEPLIESANGKIDAGFTYRSILYPFDPSTTQAVPWSIEYLLADPKKRKNMNMEYYGYQCRGASIWQLYKIAYLGFDRNYDPTGNWYNFPVLELSDVSEFEYDFSTGKNIYNYSIIVPEEKGSPEYIQRLMQQDLERYLGLSATVEKRVAPYFRLVATSEAKEKLKTKHATTRPKIEGSHSGKKYINTPIASIVSSLNVYHQGGLAIVDETEIKGNVDLELDVLLTDFDALRKRLKKLGLLLERSEKEMTVLVIRKSELTSKSEN